MARLSVSRNLGAFLDMLAHSEGTAKLGNDDGYNVIVGGSIFDGYADHPRQLIQLRPGLASTAAGRYQLLARYFDPYKKLLGLKDFSPESQDAIAIQQIKECKALQAIEEGRFGEAVAKCKHIWASLPGAGYGQLEHSLAKLTGHYLSAGGALA